jgi:hypothetical protein
MSLQNASLQKPYIYTLPKIIYLWITS